MTTQAANDRIESFIAWVNDYADRNGHGVSGRVCDKFVGRFKK